MTLQRPCLQRAAMAAVLEAADGADEGHECLIEPPWHPGELKRVVDSRFECDTELTSKCLQGGLEGEAFAGRGVEGPKQGVEVAIAVA
jgi:hypothetical protein